MSAAIYPSIPMTSISCRKEFYSVQKTVNESIGEWYDRLLLAAAKCQFGSIENVMVLDKFILGLDDSHIEHLCTALDEITLEASLRILSELDEFGSMDSTEEVRAESCDKTESLSEYEMSDEIIDDIKLEQEDEFSSYSHSHDNADDLDDTDISNGVNRMENDHLLIAVKTPESSPRKKRPYKKRATKIGPNVKVSTDGKTFTCRICDYSANRKGNVDRHIYRHLDVKCYTCQYCGKGFNSTSQLRIHIRIHTGEKPFNCHLCTKKFPSNKRLKEHLNVHNDVRSFMCTVCDGRFKQRAHLKVHMRVHTGERPYQCLICAKAFTQSNALTLHQKVHKKVGK